MNTVEITIPTVGESVKEANIGKFLIPNGQWAEKGQGVFEIETDKASMEVSAPESGVVHYKINQGDLVAIGSVVGSIDTSAAKPVGSPPQAKIPTPEKAKNGAGHSPEISAKPAVKASTPVALSEEALHGLGPAKRKAIREGKASLPTFSGSNHPAEDSLERKPMSVLRKKIAERLLHSQHSTASLTTFNEVDMSKVMATRNQLKSEFEKKHGVKLGFMSYFTKAVCYAAEHVPNVLAQIDGSDILTCSNVHISIAVSTERGLVVPVLKRANQLSYAEIEKHIGEMAEKARSGKLAIEDMVGGTFTITNGGVFGSLVSTPILNPPQSAILGMHKIEHRPMAVEDGQGGYKVEVKPMMYLAMTYDHRVIDGKESVTFVVKVKEYLENITADKVI